MKKTLILVLSTLLLCGLAMPALANAFPDVPEHHWAYKAVEELYASGLIVGYPDGSFGGQRALTRYEYAMIVSRLYQQLQVMAEENFNQASKALEAAKTAQDMAAQLSADAAAQGAPVERVIEKHLIENQPDLTSEEAAKKARDLAVLVDSLQDEFSAEIAALNERVDDLEQRTITMEGRIVRLQERQTATEDRVTAVEDQLDGTEAGVSFAKKLGWAGIILGLIGCII